MARKGNKKRRQEKKKSQKNYTKREFCEVFCQTCLICKNPTAEVCYSALYKYEPRRFINQVFRNLVDIAAVFEAMGRSLKSMSIEQFAHVICRTGICHNGDGMEGGKCIALDDCYKAFMAQMGVEKSSIVHEEEKNVISFKNTEGKNVSSRKEKKKKNKEKSRYVCTAYPTFFSSNNEKFQAAIRKILYGDHNQQQDTDKELPGGDTGAASRHAEGGKPEVHGGDSEEPVGGES
jgi:hypothetical protein